jgi:prepilin-type N-terminal cleavage/methylation domain-containing protein
MQQENCETNKNGFALIEFLVAMVLLAFGALALVQFMGLGIKLNVQTVDDTQAITLAQWKMETLLGVGYQNLVPGGDLDTSLTDYSETFSEPGSGVVYTKNWKISPCGHADTTEACDPGENYYETPWYEVSVRVYADRIEKVANTQARQVTIKAHIIQPF